MGYETSKIYRLQHDDGKFYIGSTINDLRVRLQDHKRKSKQKPERRVYQHINNEWGKVRIILIEVFECSNRDELRKKENEYIQQELDNELCLNHNKALQTKEERKEYMKAYKEQNNEAFKKYNRTYNEKHKEERKAYDTQRRERKKAEKQSNLTK
jgi:hypothetical protein